MGSPDVQHAGDELYFRMLPPAWREAADAAA
jgi:hypothetical protein